MPQPYRAVASRFLEAFPAEQTAFPRPHPSALIVTQFAELFATLLNYRVVYWDGIGVIVNRYRIVALLFQQPLALFHRGC